MGKIKNPVVMQDEYDRLAALDGPALIEEAAKYPTLDEVMRRDPRTLTEEDYVRLVTRLRADRALFIAKEDVKKAKKSGVDPDGQAAEEPGEEDEE